MGVVLHGHGIIAVKRGDAWLFGGCTGGLALFAGSFWFRLTAAWTLEFVAVRA